jgi:hypothetical protein
LLFYFKNISFSIDFFQESPLPQKYIGKKKILPKISRRSKKQSVKNGKKWGLCLLAFKDKEHNK